MRFQEMKPGRYQWGNRLCPQHPSSAHDPVTEARTTRLLGHNVGNDGVDGDERRRLGLGLRRTVESKVIEIA